MDINVQLNKKSYVVTQPQTLPQRVTTYLCCNNLSYQVLWNPDLQSIFVKEPNQTSPMLSRVLTVKHRYIHIEDDLGSKTVSFATKTNTTYQSQLSLEGLSYQKTNQHTQSTSQSYRSPIAGKVLKILTTPTRVKKNDPILIIESMKMENRIVSPSAGLLSNLTVKEGQSIKAGEVLFVVTPEAQT